MNKYYVLGNPIDHSVSPIIHHLFAEQVGLNISYERVKVRVGSFPDHLHQLLNDGMSGCNITLPFKEIAWELSDNLSQSASIAQAVNTYVVENDASITGHNTDGIGLVNDLYRNNGLSLEGKNILIAGAGGAARGIIEPLLRKNPTQIVISNRTHQKAEKLAIIFSQLGSVIAIPYAGLGGLSFDLVINATSLSIDAKVPPIPVSCIGSSTFVYDLMYAKENTTFVSWGRSLNAYRSIDGIGMLVEQAAESFYLWNNIRPETCRVIDLLNAR